MYHPNTNISILSDPFTESTPINTAELPFSYIFKYLYILYIHLTDQSSLHTITREPSNRVVKSNSIYTKSIIRNRYQYLHSILEERYFICFLNKQ